MEIAVINCIDNCEHRAIMLHDFFKAQGDKVVIYTSDYRHIAKKRRNDKIEDFEFIHVLPYKKNLSIARLRSHSSFAKAVFKKIEEKPVDLLWICIPPNSIAKHAIRYKKRHNTKVIFDVVDLWPESMPLDKQYKNLLPFVIWKNLRDDYLDYADLVVTECNLYQKNFQQNLPREKMKTLYLARNLEWSECKEGPSEESIVLCYLGSINHIIDISLISNIISKLHKFKPVIFNVIGDGENRSKLLEEAEKAGAIVNYYGIVYEKEKKLRIMSMSHYGLNIMKDSVKVGLTMKSIDYFEAGLPILNNIQGDTWDFCEKERIGINVDKLPWEQRAINENFDRNMIRNFAEKMFSKRAFDETMKKIYWKVKE